MIIELKPEHEQVIARSIQAGLIHTPDEALDFAFETLRGQLKAHDKTRAATPEGRVEAFDDFLAGFESSVTLPEEAFHRENWYPDR
jgi:hypothetical protein